MSHCPQPQPSDLPEDPGSTEVFSDGRNKVTSVQMSQAAFLANEDERMNALIALYNKNWRDGELPNASDLTPEKLFSTGMMSRTHCLRVGTSSGTIQFSVWAEDANFDGYRSMQNARFDDLSSYSVMLDALKKQLADVLRDKEPKYYEIKGIVNDHYYYYTKAVLPLRDEQCQIIKCLVPFTDKLPDIPPDLREEFCLADIHEE
jgi:hypothetical protein